LARRKTPHALIVALTAATAYFVAADRGVPHS